MSEAPHPMLDVLQIKRIEAVHGGFLYQHLYAVGCLLLAASAGASAVAVERDECIFREPPTTVTSREVSPMLDGQDPQSQVRSEAPLPDSSGVGCPQSHRRTLAR